MLNSMTGFGSIIIKNDLGQFTFEIKTWNNRFLDINVRLPGSLSHLEFVILNEIKNKISRGKIDVYIKWEPSQETLPKYDINKNALIKLCEELMEIKKNQLPDINVDAGSLLLIQGMTIPQSLQNDNEDKFKIAFIEGINLASEEVIKSRKQEGAKLVISLFGHLDQLKIYLKDIESNKDSFLERYRERLRDKVEKLLGTNEYGLDDGRLESEVLFYAERSDITEEITRLNTHIDSFLAYLKSNSNEPVGKALDFLCQELLRETNTIGSKSKDTLIATNVLKIKNEIEKIREQIQNLE